MSRAGTETGDFSGNRDIRQAVGTLCVWYFRKVAYSSTTSMKYE